MVGKKIRLRALEPSDADILYVWENDMQTWEYGDRRWPVSLSDIQTFIERSDQDIWQTRQTRLMIETVAEGATVGCIDIFDFDPLNRHCSFGIIIDSVWRRKGYAAEALWLIERFVRDTLMVHTVSVSVEEFNEASLSLFVSSGYDEVGRMKHWLRRGTSFSDQVLFQKILD